MSEDQFSRWRHAIVGNRIETERGNPASGFYRHLTGKPAPANIEAIAIYRNADGTLQCIRNVFGDGSRMTESEIDDLFGTVCMYPISEEMYLAITEHGEDWPPEYGVGGRLSLKDQAAGVVWTPEYGRRRLGGDVKASANPQQNITQSTPESVQSTPADAPKNPIAVIGHNEPPEPMSPDKALAAEISATSSGIKVWLTDIGGKPRNKAEADRLADYATVFKRFSTSATDQHRVEKAPVLEQSRAIDAKWFGPRDNAEASRKSCLRIGQEWMDAENTRRDAEARQANEEARLAATKAAQQYDAPITAPPPVEAEKVSSIGNMRSVSTRTRTVWRVDDPRAYGAFLLAMNQIPPDLLDVLGKIAQRQGAANVVMPGVSKDQKRSAA